MLTHIHISNLLSIHELHLDFTSGTTVITGESGAGKSILIEAILLALGQRAPSELIRVGADKAEISLCFDIENLLTAKNWLENHNFDTHTECIIRRTIYRDGKSRSFINGLPTTLQPLRELSEQLIQIHGQNTHQSLLSPDMQRTLLDEYADHTLLMDPVRVQAELYQSLCAEKNQLQLAVSEKKARSDYLRFQLQELEALHLTQDEFLNLDLEHKELAHSGEILKNISHALNILADNENNNLTSSLHQMIQSLEPFQEIQPKIFSWLENLKQINIQLTDIEDEIRHYLQNFDLDPNRLQWLEERLSILFEIARKHRINPQDLFHHQTKLSEELSSLEEVHSRLTEIEEKITATELLYQNHAKALSQSRQKNAEKLSKAINTLLQELSLKNSEFTISFSLEKNIIHPKGLEKVVFQLKTTLSQPFQPLAKIASGGELSRIALAIHLATANQYATPTLIFDEIDVGISGATSEMVGKLLRKLGNLHQVFCITHQPQIAALQHHHIKVTKNEADYATETAIKHLNVDEKIEELARMLGGIEITRNTLAHARELVEKTIR